MKYFIDTEFLEGTQKTRVLEILKPLKLHITLFVAIFIAIGFLNYSMIPFLVILLAIIYNFISFKRDEKPTIDLISIGIVAEDGREFYAISKDFNLKEAWNRFDLKPDINNGGYKKVYWLRENVLKPIWRELFINYELTNDIYSNKASDILVKNVELGSYDHYFSFKSLKSLLELYGKTNKEIANEINHFCNSEYHCIRAKRSICIDSDQTPFSKKPEFYAYYADYDWVVFCWLFGKMIDLPNGFPMYCRDLKQLFDQKEDWLRIPTAQNHMDLKQHTHYPKQDPSKSHNAIEDARWNKQLFDFLAKL